MTPDLAWAVAELTAVGRDDVEVAHSEADDIIERVLEQLGLTDVLDAYRSVPKWYS